MMEWLISNFEATVIVLAALGVFSAAGVSWLLQWRDEARPNRTCRDCNETYARVLGECPGCAKGRS